jgi:hypothetical protein
MVINVLVRGTKKKKTYWIPSPFGGYMEVPKSEVDEWIKVGSARLYKPDPLAIEALRRELREE